MSVNRVLLVASQETLEGVRAIVPLLTSEGLQGTVITGGEVSSTEVGLPVAVVIWAPTALAYSLFKRYRVHFSSSFTHFLLVLPSSEPVVFQVDSTYPNEAYLRGNVVPEDVFGALVRHLHGNVRVPAIGLGGKEIAPSRELGTVITVFSAKGGVGKTAIVTNLAIAIKENRSAKVLLMDGDLQFGDITVWLGLTQKVGIVELLGSGGSVDEMAIMSAVQEHESGVHALLPPSDPAIAELVSPAAIRMLIGTLQRMYDFVIIDTHTSYSDETLAMLDAADHILLIITPEISVIRNTQIFLRLCDTLGYSHKLTAVMNRANAGVRLDQLPENIRKLVKVEAVSDGRSMVYSVNAGRPLVQHNKGLPVSKGITALANLFAGPPGPEIKPAWQKALRTLGLRSAKHGGVSASANSH
jgi:MinD-like ATPase involved in chromosome partitioning or flagellar assembly